MYSKHDHTRKGSPTAHQLMAQKQDRKQKAATEEEAAMTETRSNLDAVVADLPAVRPPTTVTAPDNRSYQSRYLDEIAPSGIAGKLLKFDKNGRFITPADSAEIAQGTVFIAHVDQTIIGWQKFGETGEAPERICGSLYDGFTLPLRESLGDNDPDEWEEGLSGEPADPWQHFLYLVLENAVTHELFTFTTSSKTGRRAVGNLLRHYDRTRKANPDDYPVVKLGTGSFKHRDERIGHVTVPVFIVVGQHPRNSSTPAPTTTARIIDDKLPF